MRTEECEVTRVKRTADAPKLDERKEVAAAELKLRWVLTDRLFTLLRVVCRAQKNLMQFISTVKYGYDITE